MATRSSITWILSASLIVCGIIFVIDSLWVLLINSQNLFSYSENIPYGILYISHVAFGSIILVVGYGIWRQSNWATKWTILGPLILAILFFLVPIYGIILCGVEVMSWLYQYYGIIYSLWADRIIYGLLALILVIIGAYYGKRTAKQKLESSLTTGTRLGAQYERGEITFCGNCGAELGLNTKFCPICGSKSNFASSSKTIGQFGFCKNCGTQVTSDEQFCSQCGEKIGGTQVGQPISYDQETTTAGQGMESIDIIRILFVVTGLVPVIGIFVLNVFAMGVFPFTSLVLCFFYSRRGLKKLEEAFGFMAGYQIIGLILLFIGFILNTKGLEYYIFPIFFAVILPLIISLHAIIDAERIPIKKVSMKKKIFYGSSGIQVICKHPSNIIPIVTNPYALLNGTDEKTLEWNENVFIPLQSNRRYEIQIQYRAFGRNVARASFYVQLSPDEIQSYEYNTSGQKGNRKNRIRRLI